VVAAVMSETTLLAFLSGVLGGLLAWLFFNGHTTSTLAANGAGQLVISFKVSAEIVWIGLKWTMAIGFVGGYVLAVSAARSSVTKALREHA
jgi:putative ABC transport system permease protein